ncbi:uncharacterized protein ACNS7B_009356 [Menidia menidia]
MADVRAVLRRCDPVLLELGGDPEAPEPEAAEAAGMVLFLTDRRRVQKVLWRQLFVLDSMMSLLEGQQDLEPPPPVGGARGRWKALKAETRELEEETEALLRTLQDRIQQVQERRLTLTHLVQQLHSRKLEREQLAASLQTAQNALQACERQLEQLGAESEKAEGQLVGWQRIRERLQRLVDATQGATQVSLLTLGQSELCVELRPRLPGPSANELPPLRLGVGWSPDGRFRLQPDAAAGGAAGGGGCRGGRGLEEEGRGLEEEGRGLSGGAGPVGRRPAGRPAELGQAALLTEVQRLRSR